MLLRITILFILIRFRCYGENRYILQIPVNFDYPNDNPPKVIKHLFTLKLNEDPVDAIVLFCKKHELNYSNCNGIIYAVQKELLDIYPMNPYVQEVYEYGAIITDNHYEYSIHYISYPTNRLYIDLEYINNGLLYCSIIYYNSINSIQRFCDFHQLATIECDLLALKINTKYDINIYKS